MALVRWDPFREMMTLRNAMDRMFEDSMVRRYQDVSESGEGYLPLDVYQTENDFVVRASMPGAKPEEVDISLTGDTLTIKGEHKEEQEIKEQNYARKEIRYGSFNRSIVMPTQIQSDKVEATFDNGILTLTLPKAEAVKPKQIKIKPKSIIEGAKK